MRDRAPAIWNLPFRVTNWMAMSVNFCRFRKRMKSCAAIFLRSMSIFSMSVILHFSSIMLFKSSFAASIRVSYRLNQTFILDYSLLFVKIRIFHCSASMLYSIIKKIPISHNSSGANILFHRNSRKHCALSKMMWRCRRNSLKN